MDEATTADAIRGAWQPLTFGGVARFARAPLGRLWLLQLVFAAVTGATVLWFVATAWAPAVGEGIRRLPTEGGIRNGQLEWPEPGTARLAEGRFLTILVTPGGEESPGQVSDLQLEFAGAAVKVRSILGFVEFPYPTGWSIALNRSVLEPWWGAWRPAVYAGMVGGVMASLFIAWAALGFLYAWPSRLLALFLDRGASVWQCWKLCNAALLPGALLFTVAIVLYGLQRLSLPALLLCGPLHVALGWIYVLVSVFRLPLAEAPSGADAAPNPFEPGDEAEEADKGRGRANPFAD